VELLRPSSVAELDDGLLVHGGTEVVPLLRDGILHAETLVDVRGIVPRGVRDGCATRPGHKARSAAELCVGAGATLAELEVDPQIPDALREACRLAASPQLRNMGSIGGNLLQSTRCWYWRLKYPCRLHGGDRCHAAEGEHREHAIFANDFCASAHPSDVAAALLALDARVRTNRRELGLAELYRIPDASDRRTTTVEPGELILEIELPPVEASVYLKAMDRKRWSFPQVGVAAARTTSGTRIALAGVSPVPWLLAGPEDVDSATPLPRTAWKVDVARALVGRALAELA
jgi:xanthine dehydrogenase YagS FAD-binding subunit